MKIRSPWIIKWIGLIGACLIRLYVGTVCFRYRPTGPDVMPTRKDLRGHYIYAFWHETVLLPCYAFGHTHVAAEHGAWRHVCIVRDGQGSQRPFHSGLRFSMNADTPSRKSADM